MDIFYIFICATFVLGVLVFIHEGGHYLASKAFGVRVTEFMIGLPGPGIGFTKGGTKFGLTIIPLGGYAKVCGMTTGKLPDHLEGALASVYKRGSAYAEEVAQDCKISVEDAIKALDELVQWGSIKPPKRSDEYNIYRTPEYEPSKKEIAQANRLCMPKPVTFNEGDPRPFESAEELYLSEYAQQYRSLPFWKRSVILLAGIVVNLLFAMLAFVVIYSIIGFDYVHPQTGEAGHFVTSPIKALEIGINCIVLTFQGILSLFNPATAATTVSQSSSILGIAVMSRDFFAQSIADGLFFMAAISISLGLMNLLPIPPLDGGRFLIEIIQKVTKREISMKTLAVVSVAGTALFMGFFVLVLNQDIQRFVFGNW